MRKTFNASQTRLIKGEKTESEIEGERERAAVGLDHVEQISPIKNAMQIRQKVVHSVALLCENDAEKVESGQDLGQS